MCLGLSDHIALKSCARDCESEREREREVRERESEKEAERDREEVLPKRVCEHAFSQSQRLVSPCIHKRRCAPSHECNFQPSHPQSPTVSRKEVPHRGRALFYFFCFESETTKKKVSNHVRSLSTYPETLCLQFYARDWMDQNGILKVEDASDIAFAFAFVAAIAVHSDSSRSTSDHDQRFTVVQVATESKPNYTPM